MMLYHPLNNKVVFLFCFLLFLSVLFFQKKKAKKKTKTLKFSKTFQKKKITTKYKKLKMNRSFGVHKKQSHVLKSKIVLILNLLHSINICRKPLVTELFFYGFFLRFKYLNNTANIFQCVLLIFCK